MDGSFALGFAESVFLFQTVSLRLTNIAKTSTRS